MALRSISPQASDQERLVADPADPSPPTLPPRRPERAAPAPTARRALRVVARRVAGPLRTRLRRTPEGAWAYEAAAALASPRAPEVPLELTRKLACLREGFLPFSHVLYELDENDASDYLSDRQHKHTRAIDGRGAVLLADKVAFALMLPFMGAPTPTLEAVLTGGRLHPVTGGGEGWLRERLGSGGPLVLKPATGAGGEGVLVLRRGEDGPVVNGTPTTWAQLETRLSALDYSVVTAFVEQAEYAARIQPASTNTMRLLTMTDESGRPFLAGAYHRFGSSRSFPVDNWAQGGVSVGVDPETGRLGPGALFPTGGKVVWTSHHPETGERIEGTTVPGWTAVRDGVLALAGRLGFLPYVGWDVVVTDTGYMVIEGNHHTLVGFQVHGGLLRDPRVRSFYRRHGIVS